MVQNQTIEDLISKIAEEESVTDFLVALKCELRQEIIVDSVRAMEEKCRQRNYPSTQITRLKMVCIEMLQNISKHGENDSEVAPYFTMGINPNGFNVCSGNCVTTAAKNILVDRLNLYISLDMDQLKALYKDSLKHTSVSEHGNASLGLLDIVYRSARQVKFTFSELNPNLHYFELNLNINTNTITSNNQ